MLNKNDPLVGAIQDIMSKNQAERDAVKAVNEKFGVQDRRVLPREKQGEWDAAYKSVLTEGLHPNQQPLDVHEPKKDKLTKKDFDMLRAKKKPMEEEGDPSKAIPGDTVTGSGTVTTVPKPKPTSINPEQQKALSDKIKSIKEAKKAAMCEDTLQEKSASVQAAGAKPLAAAPTVSGPASRLSRISSSSVAGDAKGGARPAAAPAAAPAARPVMSGSQARTGGSPTSAPAARPVMSGSQARTGGSPTSAPAARPGISGSEARTGGSPTSAPAARPAVGGARPSVVAKNSYTGAQTSTGNQVGGARPSVVAKNSPSQKPYQSGAGAMTNPTQRPYDAKTSPAGATKPVQKLKPVRKQPTAGTVKPTSGGVPAKSTKPARNSTVLGRVGAARRRDKNNDVGPGNP